MRILYGFVLAISLTCAAAWPAYAREETAAASTPDLAAICAQKACRKGGFNEAVFFDETHLKDIPVNASPYVTDEGEVLIFPGETFAVSYTVKDGILSSPTYYRSYVPEFSAGVDSESSDGTSAHLTDNPDNASFPQLPSTGGDVDVSALPANTVVISYGQRDHSGAMQMTIRSNIQGVLKFDARMMIVFADKPGYQDAPTSTCPIAQNHTDFEEWPKPLGPTFLSNARLLPPDAKMVCE